jgi:hypothetical protein
LARDYERRPEHAEAMIEVAMIRLMAARLAGEDYQPRGQSSIEPTAGSPSKTDKTSPASPHSGYATLTQA